MKIHFHYRDFALTRFEIEAQTNSGMAHSQSPIPNNQSNLFQMPLVYFKTKFNVHVRQARAYNSSLPLSVSQIERSMLAFCFSPELINLCLSSILNSISVQGKAVAGVSPILTAIVERDSR